MRSKTASLHPLLILLAVALVSVLFVVSRGGGATATAVPAVGAAEAADAEASAEAAAAQALADAAELAAFTDAVAKAEKAAAQAAQAAAKAAAEVGAPKRGGTLVFAMFPNEVTLDPPLLLGETDVAITQQVYDNLLMIQPDFTVKPELATSWEPNEDFSSYTFHLREGVKFHNGKDFKA